METYMTEDEMLECEILLTGFRVPLDIVIKPNVNFYND